MYSHRFIAPRILIQDSETGSFLKLLRGWTNNPLEAHDFQTTANALEFCRQGRLEGVQLVLESEGNLAVADPAVRTAA